MRFRPKRTPPDEELKKRLLKIAIDTDIIGSYPELEKWRITAITAARWLLLVAAEAKSEPVEFKRTMNEIKKLSEVMNDQIMTDSEKKIIKSPIF